MPILGGNNADTMPTLLTLASRIRRNVTKEALTSLNDDPINNVIVDAVNDAISDIYYRDRWNWLRTTGNIKLVSGASAYALPADFQRLCTEPVINNVTLKEISPEEWSRNIYSPSWNSSSTISGQPTLYMVDRSVITFWPQPSDSFIAQQSTIHIDYYRKEAKRFALTDGGASPDVPPEFIEAIVSFGNYKLKVFLQFDDFQVDRDRYEQIITNRIQTDMISAHPPRWRPRSWRTANFG